MLTSFSHFVNLETQLKCEHFKLLYISTFTGSATKNKWGGGGGGGGWRKILIFFKFKNLIDTMTVSPFLNVSQD